MSSLVRLAVVDASVAIKWQMNDEECVVESRALRDDYFTERVAINLMAPKLMEYATTACPSSTPAMASSAARAAAS